MNEELIETKKDHKKLFKVIKIIIIIAFLISSILLYSRFISTSGICVHEFKISNESLPESFNGSKIVHISDIHYGRTINKNALELLVKKINETKPDIVIFSGDLIDKDTKLTENMVNDIIEVLNKIDSKLGKFAIKGNHDYSFSEFDKIITDSHFKLLSDEFDLIYSEGNEPITIVGLNSNLKSNEKAQDRLNNIETQFANIVSNYKILIIHEPDYIDEIDYSKYNIVLSGHSHAGQIRLPFIGSIITPIGAKKYDETYYKLNNTDFYISSGIGTSTISFRLFNKPSFNLYRLTK